MCMWVGGGWKIVSYVDVCVWVFGLKNLYADVLSAVDDFFINGIQTLQHQCKSRVDHKWDYVEK